MDTQSCSNRIQNAKSLAPVNVSQSWHGATDNNAVHTLFYCALIPLAREYSKLNQFSVVQVSSFVLNKLTNHQITNFATD